MRKQGPPVSSDTTTCSSEELAKAWKRKGDLDLVRGRTREPALSPCPQAFLVAAKSGDDSTRPTLQSTLLFLGKYLGDSSPRHTVVVRMPAHSTKCASCQRGGLPAPEASTGWRQEGEVKKSLSSNIKTI